LRRYARWSLVVRLLRLGGREAREAKEAPRRAVAEGAASGPYSSRLDRGFHPERHKRRAMVAVQTGIATIRASFRSWLPVVQIPRANP
jgi:hypothetical protein